MNSKKQFSFKEVCEIHIWSRELGKLQAKRAGKNEQMRARRKLRTAGFYISDYKSKKT